jgi:hypothetical protein
MTRRLLCSALLLALSLPAAADSFTYRGELLDEGVPADGRYELQFRLFAQREGGAALAETVEVRDVAVVDGRFATALELPALATQHAWLEVAVRGDDDAAFRPLGAREAVSLKAAACPTGWDLFGNAGTNPATNFLGTTDLQPVVIRSSNYPVATLSVNDNGATEFTAIVRFGAPTNQMMPSVAESTIGGGSYNVAHDNFTTIAGGNQNEAGISAGPAFDGTYATVGGGSGNIARGTSAVIGGGSQNRALGSSSTVAGGSLNQAGGLQSTIGGGSSNVVNGPQAVIAGGSNNRADGDDSVIAGGTSNGAGGDNSFVAGGSTNCAGASHAWAGGHRARVRGGTATVNVGTCGGIAAATPEGDIGTFAWADSQDADLLSTAPDQFLVRAQGGVGINAPPLVDALELSVTADADGSDFANIFMRQRSNNAGVLMSAGGATATGDNNAGFFIDHYNAAGGQNRRLALNSDGSVVIRSNITASNTGVSMAAGAGAWSSLSDRRLKTAIQAVDARAVLDGLLRLPLSTWSYRAQGEGVRHLGPMAQDFARAFGLGENDTTISTIDADGVALAAIQGLNAKLESDKAALEDRLAALERELARMQRALAELRSGGR